MSKINFDHMGYSKVIPSAAAAAEKYLKSSGGNPLSIHYIGSEAAKAIESARMNVANLINAAPEEIVFTSCGSESNNLAIKGLLSHRSNKGKHIIASPIEHHSVLHPLKSLKKEGYDIMWLNVDSDGFVNPSDIKDAIRDDTVLISVIYASPEIGTVEPVNEIGKIADEHDILFHTDAVAAAGRVGIDVKKEKIDLLSLASNPIYGPQGAAALYIKKGVRLKPLIEGGVQEKGLRAGTHNVPAIAGFGQAAKVAAESIDKRGVKVDEVSRYLIKKLPEKIPHTLVTGSLKERLPGHASFCVKYIEGESMNLNLNMNKIAATSGSTCSSQALKVSNVLEAIGVDAVAAQGSIVFFAGIENSLSDAEYLIEKLKPVVEKLRKMSPVYKDKEN